MVTNFGGFINKSYIYNLINTFESEAEAKVPSKTGFYGKFYLKTYVHIFKPVKNGNSNIIKRPKLTHHRSTTNTYPNSK